jgi:hypothetical protein
MSTPIRVSVVFMALSLLAFMRSPTLPSAMMFVTSAAVFGFLCWLDHRNMAAIDEIKADVHECVEKVNSISVALNWNQT